MLNYSTCAQITSQTLVWICLRGLDEITIYISNQSTENFPSPGGGSHPVSQRLTTQSEKADWTTSRMQFLLPRAGPMRAFLAWNIISFWVLCFLAFGRETWSSLPVLRPDIGHRCTLISLVSLAWQLQIWRLSCLLNSINPWRGAQLLSSLLLWSAASVHSQSINQLQYTLTKILAPRWWKSTSQF